MNRPGRRARAASEIATCPTRKALRSRRRPPAPFPSIFKAGTRSGREDCSAGASPHSTAATKDTPIAKASDANVRSACRSRPAPAATAAPPSAARETSAPAARPSAAPDEEEQRPFRSASAARAATATRRSPGVRRSPRRRPAARARSMPDEVDAGDQQHEPDDGHQQAEEAGERGRYGRARRPMPSR